MSELVIDDPFVGREPEIADLTAALDDAQAGRGRMVMLVGEPGIGKTRTAEELASIAQDRGAEVFWGNCPEERGAPSYWPWVQIIRKYAATRDAETVSAEMGPGAPVIAEVVSELREQLPDLPSPPSISDLEVARFRLFDSIASFLKRTSQNNPLVLVFDNLHWSDEASLRLLEFVAQDLTGTRVLIVGTYRDVDVSRGHPLYRALGDLSRQRLFSRFLLRGLDQEHIGQLISIESKTAAPQSLVENVYEQTEGNPLFVGEMVRLLAGEGLLHGGTNSRLDLRNIRLPEGIRETIGRRLDRLSGISNETLMNAAIIGRQFELKHLVEIDENHSEDELLEALEEAVNAHVIAELPGEVGAFEFTHALVRQTLAGELSATRTVRMHARIAKSLEQLHGSDADDHAEELIGHFIQAETVLGKDPVLHYAVVAGRRALDAIDPSSAVDHFESGIDAFGSRKVDERLADLLSGLGRAQANALERAGLQMAIDNLTRAFDIYLELGRTDSAIQTAMTPMWSAHGPSGRADLLERALEIAQDGTDEQARLLAEFGLWASHERADYRAAKNALSKAMTFAERTGDTRLQLRIHHNAAPVHSWNFNYHEKGVSALAAIRLAEQLDDPTSAVDPHYHAGWLQLYQGDVDTARYHANACSAAAARTRSVFQWTSAMYLKGSIALVVGDWDAVRESFDYGLSMSPTEIRLLVPYIEMEFRLGNFDMALERLEFLDASVKAYQPSPLSDLLHAIGASYGRPSTIPLHLEASARDFLETDGKEPLAYWPAFETLLRIAVHKKDQSFAAELCARPLFNTPSDYRSVLTIGLRARTEWIAGKSKPAESSFEKALEFSLGAGYMPNWAETTAYYAESLLERGSAADQRKSAKLIGDVTPVVHELGMKPLITKLQSLSDAVKVGSPESPGGLTERELEVLRLVATGNSNQRIADQLFLSRYTVVRHISNIFGKIDAANRAEATTFAHEHDLLDNSPDR